MKKKRAFSKIDAGLSCLDAIKILKYEIDRKKSERLSSAFEDVYMKYIHVMSLIDKDTFKKKGRPMPSFYKRES